jgi:tol-pal system protein YbgF
MQGGGPCQADEEEPVARPIRRLLVGLLGIAIAGGLTGCVMPDEVARLQKDVADLHQEIRRLEAKEAESLEKLRQMEGRLADGGGVSRADIADLRADMEMVTRQVSALDERINEANRRMDLLSQDVQASRELARRGALAPPAPARGADPSSPPSPAEAAELPAGAVPNPEALYNAAYADFSKGNFALAISGFEEYAARFPDSDLADNALYWVGECWFSQGNFDRAVEAFDQMLERYPRSDRAAAANLKKGLAFLERNQVAQALVQLRYVVSTYPGSDEARLARDKLASLGAPVH